MSTKLLKCEKCGYISYGQTVGNHKDMESHEKDCAGKRVYADDIECENCSALEKRNEELEGALRGVYGIIDDSTGVEGYHLNGAIAEWDEFPEVQEAYDVLPPAEDKDVCECAKRRIKDIDISMFNGMTIRKCKVCGKKIKEVQDE